MRCSQLLRLLLGLCQGCLNLIQACGCCLVGLGLQLQGGCLHLQLADPPVQHIQGLWFQGGLHLDLGSCLVHQVYGLVWQEATVDVARTQRSCCHKRTLRNLDAMVSLITLAQSSQDADGLLHAGLVCKHLLEAPLQSRVLLDSLLVLVQCAGTDAAELSTGQRRLEQGAAIHHCCTLCTAGRHKVVDVINEQHHAATQLCQLVQHLLQALLKLARHHAACCQRTQVQLQDLDAHEAHGHIPVHHALRQAFHDGCLAHSALSNQHWIVLGAARKDVHTAADFIISTYDRVQLAHAC
mmetsp:Transcript_3666/g.9912  ORF Transcript_3666/g.9912 Transcript_3666/m.9912 type:complete len:296 (-) Transcript_3666:714-1601(-)